MKRFILGVMVAGAMAWVAYGQGNSQRRVQAVPGQPGAGIPIAGMPGAQDDADLPKFDLDFPGGKPEKLVEAIREQITGGILNAIIPVEYATVQLPPMKLKGVNVKQLFEALEFATQKQVPYQTGFRNDGQVSFSTTMAVTTFRTTGPVTPESVWYFHVSKPPVLEMPSTVRYFQLGPYLTNYKIDDITTAIKAGWKMLDGPIAPEMNFHEDTKLLIAVGQVGQLNMIDSVLAELNKGLSAETREKIRVTGKPEPSPSK